MICKPAVVRAGVTKALRHKWEGEIAIVVARLDVDPATLTLVANVLSESERQRALQYTSNRNRSHFVLSRGVLRYLIAERLSIEPDRIEFEYGPYGKPRLATGLTDIDLRFNLSHSCDLAVYAFALGREVGVDIQAKRDVYDSDLLARHCFSIREFASYLALPPQERTLGFLNCWTRKEAFVKALGEGFYYPFEKFDVSLAPHLPARILRMGQMPGESCGWRLETFSPDPDFVGAIVIEDPLSSAAHVAHQATPRSKCYPVHP